MNTTWKAAAGVILVFVLGWFGGALTTIIIARHIAHQSMIAIAKRDPEVVAKLLEQQTTRNLGLNDDQKKQLHDLFIANVGQRMAIQLTIQPQVKTVNAETLKQINALLSPDQQKQFHENLLLFKKRFGRNPFNVKEEDETAASKAPAASPSTNSSATVPQ